MTRDDDFLGQLEGYLDDYEGSTPLPEDVRNAIRAKLPSLQQRRTLWPARRLFEMNNVAKLAMAAAAVLVAAVVGISMLAADDRVGVGASSTSPSASLTPTHSPSPTPQVVFPPEGDLAVGRYSMIVEAVPFTLEVPSSGWASDGFPWIGKATPEGADGASMAFWSPVGVYSDPCSQTTSPPAGPSTADLAAAMVSVPGIDVVTAPREVTVGGYLAQHLVLTVREDPGCDANDFHLWYSQSDQDPCDGPNPCGRYATALGQTISVWIIDADGTRLVIEGETYRANNNPEFGGEIQAIIDSIRFE